MVVEFRGREMAAGRRRRDPFVMVPLALLGVLRSPMLISIWVVLKTYCIKSNICYPSLATMANTLGCHKQTVMKAIKKLESLGIINVFRSRKHNFYQVFGHASQNPRFSHPGSSSLATLVGGVVGGSSMATGNPTGGAGNPTGDGSMATGGLAVTGNPTGGSSMATSVTTGGAGGVVGGGSVVGNPTGGGGMATSVTTGGAGGVVTTGGTGGNPTGGTGGVIDGGGVVTTGGTGGVVGGGSVVGNPTGGGGMATGGSVDGGGVATGAGGVATGGNPTGGTGNPTGGAGNPTGGTGNPSLGEVENYIKRKSLKVNAAAFLRYYAESGWLDSKGVPVQNWQQKLILWHLNPWTKNPQQKAKRGAEVRRVGHHLNERRENRDHLQGISFEAVGGEKS